MPFWKEKDKNFNPKQPEVITHRWDERQFAELLRIGWEFHKSHARIERKVDELMSAISEFSARVNTAFDTIGTSVDGLVSDVAKLKADIEALQNNPGPISAEDQALLDGIESRVGTVASNLATLDAATESVPTP